MILQLSRIFEKMVIENSFDLKSCTIRTSHDIFQEIVCTNVYGLTNTYMVWIILNNIMVFNVNIWSFFVDNLIQNVTYQYEVYTDINSLC